MSCVNLEGSITKKISHMDQLLCTLLKILGSGLMVGTEGFHILSLKVSWIEKKPYSHLKNINRIGKNQIKKKSIHNPCYTSIEDFGSVYYAYIRTVAPNKVKFCPLETSGLGWCYWYLLEGSNIVWHPTVDSPYNKELPSLKCQYG